jgi:hypothetical protein
MISQIHSLSLSLSLCNSSWPATDTPTLASRTSHGSATRLYDIAVAERLLSRGRNVNETYPDFGFRNFNTFVVLLQDSNNLTIRYKISSLKIIRLFFLIGAVRGGVQLGPFGTAATNRPIVPAAGDYDDGEICGMIGKGNRSIRRKPAPVPLCPPHTAHAFPDANPGPGGGKPATNHMSYGRAFYVKFNCQPEYSVKYGNYLEIRLCHSLCYHIIAMKYSHINNYLLTYVRS